MSIDNAKYDKIYRKYQQRQLDRMALLDSRKQEIYSRLPAFKRLDDEMASLSASAILERLSDSSRSGSDSESFAFRRKALSQEKQKLLIQAGYPADYLNPPYICPLCKDTGYINYDKCRCFTEDIINELYLQSNIRDVLEYENFSAFSYELYTKDELPRIQQIRKTVDAFISAFGKSFNNLLLIGSVGCGKTFISNCIAKELLERGFSVIYLTAYQLFDLLSRRTFHHDEYSGDSEDIYEGIFNCDLLIIDDLGTETSSFFTSSELFVILNERIVRKKSTLISTNLDMNHINNVYSERLVSRFLGYYTAIEFDFADIRSRKVIYN